MISSDAHSTLCVKSGPPGSRSKDEIKSARDLLREMSVKDDGERELK